MSKLPNLYVFYSDDALAHALRSYIIQSQNASLNRNGIFKVAVSTRSLPKTILAKALLAAPSRSDDTVKFDKWEIFFTDECAVPLDHPDSNYSLLKSEVLDKIPAGAGVPTVHTIDDLRLGDTQELADEYERELVRSFANRDSVKLPPFDLMLLGCGSDGHTCSLFPGHSLLHETTLWVAPIEDAPKPRPKRITLTLPVVTHSVNAVFVASGSGKKEVLKQTFENGNGLPCALVNETMGDRCSWFVDNAAVEGVSFPRRLMPPTWN